MVSFPSSLALTVVRRLAAAGCTAAEDEARELLAGASHEVMLESWMRRREAGEPLAWITGSVQFSGQCVSVHPGVFVPRPQSEELARRAGQFLATNGGRAVDLCTGAGAIALYLMTAAPQAAVLGVDIDVRAVLCARRNGVVTVQGDLDEALRSKSFNLVTAVAPYVPSTALRLLPADVQRYEPRLALDGGSDGLSLLRRIVIAAARLLRPGGRLLIEVGGDQDDGLARDLSANGFELVESWFDEDGDLRGLSAGSSPDVLS